MKNTIFKTLFILATIIVLNACKGSQGDIGPAGPMGATGPQGPKGDAGTTTTSNNVIQITFTKTFVPPYPLQGTQYFTFPSSITTEMLNNSALVVYVKTSNFPGSWVAVPGAGIADNGIADVLRYTLHATEREIGIVRESGTSITTITQVRVIIIPAATTLNGQKTNVYNNNYAALKEAYGLKD